MTGQSKILKASSVRFKRLFHLITVGPTNVLPNI